MKLIGILPVIFCMLFYNAIAAQSYNLTVNISGFRDNKGTLYISLYNSKEGYPKDYTKAFRLSYSAITNNKCSVLFDGIPKGTYGIACYHDENGNGKMDTNFFG